MCMYAYEQISYVWCIVWCMLIEEGEGELGSNCVYCFIII